MLAAPWAFGLAGFDDGETGEISSLAEMPGKFSDSWFSEAEDFINDHAPMRTRIINIQKKMTEAFKAKYNGRLVPILKAVFNDSEEVSQDPQPTVNPEDIFGRKETADPENPETTPEAESHVYEIIRRQTASFMHDGYTLKKCTECGAVTITDIVYRTSLKNFYSSWPTLTYSGAGFAGAHDWYFYAGDDSVGYYQGDNVLSDSEMAGWKDTLERLQAICDGKGIKLVCWPAPTRNRFTANICPQASTRRRLTARNGSGFLRIIWRKTAESSIFTRFQDLKPRKFCMRPTSSRTLTGIL